MTAQDFLRLEKEFNWDIKTRAECSNALWRLNSAVVVKLDYPEEGYAGNYALETHSFWFRYRNRVIADAWKRHSKSSTLWEIGSGTGVVASHLQALGVEAVCVEPSPTGAAISARRGLPTICASFEELGLPQSSLEAIGCFDVLEHLPDPQPLVQEFFRTLKPGGLLLATVPALPWLWSQVDEFSGHSKRYTKRELAELCSRSGFTAIELQYFLGSMVIPLFYLRTVPYRFGIRQNDEKLLAAASAQLRGPGQNGLASRMLNSMLETEYWVSQQIPLPLGTSVLGVFRKP